VQQQEENRKKLVEKDKLSNQIAQASNRNYVVRKGGRRYLKTIMFTVKAFISLMLQARKNLSLPPGAKKRE
jgi:hypothetical protein